MERQVDEWDLVVKVKHGDILRRIGAYVNGQRMDLNMNRLKSKIVSLFKFSPDAELILTYTDEDGDIVTLDDDDELRDAVIGQRLNPLRINVQLKSSDGSDASSMRSNPTNSTNAPVPETLPPPDKQEKHIPEPLLGVVSNLVGLAQEAITSSPSLAQKVDDVMRCEPLRSAVEGLPKEMKEATSHFPALARVIEQLFNSGLSNVGPTSGPSGESSGVASQVSTDQVDPDVTKDPKRSNGSIPGATKLSSNATDSVNPIPKQNVSSDMGQGVGPMTSSADLNADASKNAKSSMYPIDDLLASIWTANNSPEYEKEVGNTDPDRKSGAATVMSFVPTSQPFHGSGNCWTPVQPFPTYIDGSANIMGGDSSSKQPLMKGDSSPLSRTGLSSHTEVPINRQVGAPPCVNVPMLSEVIKTHSRRKSHIQNANMLRTFHRGVQCDGCGMHPIVGPRFKSIVKEDYDLCNICFTQMGNETDYTRIDHPHHRAPRLLKEFHKHHAKFCLQPSNVLHGCGVRSLGVRPHRAKLESRFIQDVTVLDGTVMPPSTHFTKIWRLRNNGNAPWPFGTQLVWVDGDQFGDRVSAELEILPSGFPVDKELDIAVDFTAPSRPGRYVSYWRMASPSGQEFGQRVWVLIQVDCSPPNSAAGSGFHPDLNLNLPPESSGHSGTVIIDVNVEPLDIGFPETNFPSLNDGVVKPVAEDVPSGLMDEPAARVDGSLLDARNDELPQPAPAAVTSPSASYPLIDLQSSSSMTDASSPVAAAAVAANGNPVEQTLLKELEEMGFKQIDLNKEILRLNEYDLEQSVDDLCGFAEWDPLLSELQEMGFIDKELNKKLLIKNEGSIKRTVLDLIAGKLTE